MAAKGRAKGKPDTGEFRDRITGLTYVKASELRRNQKNWRRHPATQAAALTELLTRIGWAGVVTARETPDGLEMLDGHLRADIAGDAQVPVIIVNVNDDEADLLLATIDPIASLAEIDGNALAALVRDMSGESEQLEGLLRDLEAQAEMARLDDLNSAGKSGPAPASGGTPEGWVHVDFVMPPAKRDALLAKLQEIKDAKRLRTQTDALLHLAEIEVG